MALLPVFAIGVVAVPEIDPRDGFEAIQIEGESHIILFLSEPLRRPVRLANRVLEGLMGDGPTGAGLFAHANRIRTVWILDVQKTMILSGK